MLTLNISFGVTIFVGDHAGAFLRVFPTPKCYTDTYIYVPKFGTKEKLSWVSARLNYNAVKILFMLK